MAVSSELCLTARTRALGVPYSNCLVICACGNETTRCIPGDSAMTERSDQSRVRERFGRCLCGRYVHGRRNGSRCRIGVLLGFEEAELRPKLVSTDMLALADRGHWSRSELGTCQQWRYGSPDILVLCYIHINKTVDDLIRWPVVALFEFEYQFRGDKGCGPFGG